LGRQDHEGLRERVSSAVQRHLPLIHGFQKGALRARGCPIDLIGKYDMVENRPGLEMKLLACGIIDHGSEKV